MPRIPVVQKPMWHISNNPDLGEFTGDAQEVVDHAIWQSADGRWHLWACIRGTRIGRLLYAWEGGSLEHQDWEPKGVAMRRDRAAGESHHDWHGQEWIQAPHVSCWDRVYYMFYGGHSTEADCCQICVATSEDGRTFARRRDDRGYSRVFQGPGEARDPMVIRIGDYYHCYYTGHDPCQQSPCKIYCRTSADLARWSDYVAVNWGGSGGDGPYSAECPFVVALDNLYYLFRTSRYRPPAQAHVYCSEDPLDFGRGDDSHKVAELRLAATEVVLDGGRYYVSTVEDLQGGIQLARLDWR